MILACQQQYSLHYIEAAPTQTFHNVPGLNAFVFAPSPFSGGSHQDLEFTLTTSGTYKNLYYAIEKMKKSLANYAGINNINSDMDFNSQQYDITVNRDLAASLGVSIAAIDNTIATFLGGSTITYFDMDNYRYDVILQASPQGSAFI